MLCDNALLYQATAVNYKNDHKRCTLRKIFQYQDDLFTFKTGPLGLQQSKHCEAFKPRGKTLMIWQKEFADQESRLE